MGEKDLGLGVKFTATVGDFAAQLTKIEEQLKSFAKNLEAMGGTAEKAGKALTSANKDAEKAITQVTAATKEAVTATSEAAKAAETLASGMEKAKSSVSGAGSAAGKMASDLKGLNFEQTNMLTGVGKLVSDPVMGSLVDKLKKASTESIGYQKGLVGAAKEAGNSEIAFKTLSAALMTNEKYLSTVADGTKKVRSELGANALPKDMQAVVEGVDRLKFAQATLAGEMFKTGGVVLDGRSKFVELQKTIAGLTETHGQAAMSYTDAASRLGSYGTTVKSITGELKAYNAMHGEAVNINEKITASIAKMNALYGGPGGLASSTGKYRTVFDGLMSSYRGAPNEIVGIEQAAKRVYTAFVESEKGTIAWNEAIKNTGVITPRTATVIQGLQNAVSGGIMTQKEATKALVSHNAELGKLSEVANRPRGILAGLSQSLSGGASAASKAEGYFARLGTAIGSLAAWIPAAMIISTLTEAIMGSIIAVKDYDQSLKSLQAISGGTDAEIDLLGKTMLQLSADTKYSAAEIAKGAIYIAQAGFTAGESMDVIAAAAKGAQGTLEPLTTAADLLTTVLRAFHIDASEASVVMDKLAMAANKSKTDLEGMKVVFNYLGPAAYSAGLSLNEVLGSLMALSNVGMRMSTVGTSLRQVFIGLENPSAKLKAALAALGMTVDDLSVKKMGGLIPVLVNLDKVIGGSLTNAVQFFNVRAGNAALVMSQMNEHVKMMIDFTKEYGASAAMAGTQTEGMSVKISMLSNQFQNFIIRMAEGGLTNAFKTILDVAGSLIKVIEYLVNNPFTNFIITAGIMYASLIGLRSVILMVGNALSTILVGASLQASVTAINMMGVMVALKDVWVNIIIVVTRLGAAIWSTIAFFLTLGTSTTALTAATGFLKEAWIALNAVFAKSPLGLLVTGLALLAAAIYTVVANSEKQSKALQENAITLANNEQAATRFAVKLRELDAEQKTGIDNSDSYVAVLKQIKETFPEVTSELVKNKGSLEAQAVALDKVAANYAKLNEMAAKAAMGDLIRQYNLAGVEIGVYSRALSENRSLLEQTAIAITSMIPGTISLIASLFGVKGATEEANRAWTNIKLAWNNMSDAQLANDAATKLSEAMNRQRELFPQVASIIINSSKQTRQALIEMIPEGEMKKAALATVEMHDRMVASLIVKGGELKEKEISAVVEMGYRWVEYYKRQDEMGQAEISAAAIRAKKKIDAEMKIFEKGETDNKLRLAERIRLEEEASQKMLDLRSKNIDRLLGLEDKLYEEQHKRRKAALDATLVLLDLEQKDEIVALGNRGLREGAYLKAKEKIEEEYYMRNKIAIENNATAELASLANLNAAKMKTLEVRKSIFESEETYQAKIIVLETENAVKTAAIYKEELTAFKGLYNEKYAEFNKYKAEYDRAIKELERLENEHIQVSLAANKKYQTELAALNLAHSKQTEDIEKLIRDARQTTMTEAEKARDKLLEFNETIAKGYKALAEADMATTSTEMKEKTRIAQDYFKEAQGMIKGLVKENVDANGTITRDVKATADAQVGFYGVVQKGMDAILGEGVKAIAKEREETIKASTDKRAALEADLKAIAEATKKNMASAKEEVDSLFAKCKEITNLLAKALVIEADTTKVKGEIDKLITYMEEGKVKGAFNIVIQFLGALSPPGPLGETLEKAKVMVTTFQEWLATTIKDILFTVSFKGAGISKETISLSEAFSLIKKVAGELTEEIKKMVPDFVVNFKGNNDGFFWLGSLIDHLSEKMKNFFIICNKVAAFVVNFVGFGIVDSLISKMQALYAASNRTATFTTKFITEGSPPPTGTPAANVTTEGSYTPGPSSPGYAESGQGGGYGGESGGYSEGGKVPGSGEGDTVEAMVTPGEFIVRAPVVKGLGEGFFHFVNSLKSFTVPKFNMGGLVPSFANGGLVSSHETFTLNLQVGPAKLPLKVVGSPKSMRQNIRAFEKELNKMRLSHG